MAVQEGPGSLGPTERNARLFDTLSPTYDAVGVEFFGPIARHLVESLEIAPGAAVADIGCGRGAFLLPAAVAAGSKGRVVGLDVSPGMVAEARRAASLAGLNQVEVFIGDAQAPDLPAKSFDVVGSSLVLFFLPDPASALRAWGELLVPGGRLGISTFGPVDAAWEHVDAVFEPYLPQGMLDARASGKKGSFASDEGVAGLVGSAGFHDVRTLTVDLPVRFADPDQWYAFSMSVGQRAMWDAIPDHERAKIRTDAEHRLAAAADPSGGFLVHQQVRYTFANL